MVDVDLRDYQVDVFDRIVEAGRSGKTSVLACMPTGCHPAGTRVLTPEGYAIPVEEVEDASYLASPEGGVKEVLGLIRGEGMIVRVVPTKGEPFLCNDEHVLSLVHTVTGKYVDVRVCDYMTWSQTAKHVHKLYRVGYNFSRGNWPPPPPLSPYLLGALLGDGSIHHGSPCFHNIDPEVLAAIRHEADLLGLTFRQTSDVTWSMTTPRGQSNPLIDALRKASAWGVSCGDKRIPFDFLTGFRPARLDVLAGLLDTDGSLSGNGFDFISKSQGLSADVAFVARSLGLAAYVTECTKHCQTGASGTYWRVSITGHTDMIPMRCVRKRALPRQQIKDVLRTGFTIEPVGWGKYYGFTLTGDGRYLLDNFTVTHNSGKTRLGAAFAGRAAKTGQRVLGLAHRRELVAQMARSFTDTLRVPIGIVQAGVRNPHPEALIQIASAQTLLSRGERPPAHLLIVDEAHHYAAKAFRELTLAYPDAFKLGLSATPQRGDGKPLNMFQVLIDGPQPAPLIAAGHLVPCDIIAPSSALTGGIAWCPVESYIKHALGRRCINFAQTVEQSKAIVTGLLNAGVNAAHMDMDTHPKLRDRILNNFAQGHLHVVSNCTLLTEGVDIPSCEVTMLSRPISTLALYLQAVGRSLRPAPGKGSALLLDLRGACHIFGGPEVNREYSLDGEEGLKGAKPDMRERTCSQCEAIRPMGPGACPTCGFQPGGPRSADGPAIEGEELHVIKHVRKDPACVEVFVRMLADAERQGLPRVSASDAYWRKLGCFPEGTWVRWYEAWKAGAWTSPDMVPPTWPLASLGIRGSLA